MNKNFEKYPSKSVFVLWNTYKTDKCQLCGRVAEYDIISGDGLHGQWACSNCLAKAVDNVIKTENKRKKEGGLK